MQTVSLGDSLYLMSNPIFWQNEKKNLIKLSSAEPAHGMVSVIIIYDIIVRLFHDYFYSLNRW